MGKYSLFRPTVSKAQIKQQWTLFSAQSVPIMVAKKYTENCEITSSGKDPVTGTLILG